MIDKEREVIYHRAHALLAAEIAGHWNAKNRPQRWLETIAAISHHDDLAREWELFILHVDAVKTTFTSTIRVLSFISQC